MTKKFCGYISIVGKPNVGKSTLLNTILDKKISITSRKSQTTRNNIIGVKTDNEFQMIFLDTPGIHMQAKKTLNKVLNLRGVNYLWKSKEFPEKQFKNSKDNIRETSKCIT